MIWPEDFSDRLKQWHDLRVLFVEPDLEHSLLLVNDWWFTCPISPRCLAWDDQITWPDPWNLLKDNVYCDLARGLGMLYTLCMTQDPRLERLQLARTNADNLVLVNDGKYILNWAPRQLLNISSENFKIEKTIDSGRLLHLMG